MPELPEVETVKRGLCERMTGCRIRSVRVFDPRVIRGMSPARFIHQLKGKKVLGIHRRGKALILELSPGRDVLVVQLMMTGQLVCAPSFRRQKATKLVFILSNGNYLLYNDQRLFGRLQIVKDLQTIKYFRVLGPEPLEWGFTLKGLQDGLKKTARPIKNALLDHTFVAGIGNIYASEILFAAGMDPRRLARELKPPEVKALFAAIRKVLLRAIRYRGTSMNTYRDALGQRGNFMAKISVYGRDGESCGVCKRTIQRIVMAGRSTFFCPHCQT